MINSHYGAPYSAYFHDNGRIVGFGPLKESDRIYEVPQSLFELYEAGRLRFSAPITHHTEFPNEDGWHEIEFVGFHVTVLPEDDEESDH